MIKLVSFFFIFVLSVKIVLASDIYQFVFTTNSQTIKLNQVSETITIQAQDIGSIAISAGKTLCLKVISTSGVGEFSSNSSEWIPVNIFTINSNWKSRSFYYKDSSEGNYRIDAQVAFKLDEKTCSLMLPNEWDVKWNASQNIVVSADSSSSVSQAISSSTASSNSSGAGIVSGSVSYTPKSEQISANAGEDKTAIAGADIVLEGQAFGFKDEPILNARYLWTLGDGSYKEGQSVRHIYKYPGNYIAVLNASSGDVSASDIINVKVVPNELEIIEAKNEFIKLKNKSGLMLDLSGWFLRTGGSVFKFPDHSLISSNAELIIPSDVSGLKFFDNNFSAEMLYPNGSPAFYYEKQKQTILPKIVESSNDLSAKIAKPKEEIIAKQPENKNNSKTILKQDKVSTTSEDLIAKNNLAGAIAISGKSESNFIGWIGLATLVGIIGGGGIFLARKFNN